MSNTCDVQMNTAVESVLIGGGQAGLATSYHLNQRGREHIVLEQTAQAGNAWRNDRWDSFTLVTPNWSYRMPGAEYQGSAPDGSMPQFARDGVVLLGHLQGVRENTISLAPGLKENLAKADRFEAEITAMIDRLIAGTGSDAPPESLPVLRDGYEAEEITELSLTSARITTVIWAMGYTFDFSLVKLPVFDSDGYPTQERGVTEYPGLFFVGLPWLYKWKSGQLIGVGEDADFIASAIVARKL